MKLLAVGDVHLGRRPSRLPDALQVRAKDLGPPAAWHRIVNLAIEERVTALLLAGDVLESDKDFFEGYRELRCGIESLTKAGIEVLAVAGNHDARALPRLADEVSGLRLLGREGLWSFAEIEAGGERATIWGWSFPASSVKTSPILGLQPRRASGLNIGLLHCDLDQHESPYAPVSRGELEGALMDAWLLGHIHKPTSLALPRPIGYLGSATGLDPSEDGRRGPWLMTIRDGAVRELEHLSVSPLLWERIEVDLTEVTVSEDAQQKVLQAARALDERISGDRLPPLAVGLRVIFVGRTGLGEAVSRCFSPEDCEDIFRGQAGTHYFVERLLVATDPEISLEVLARQPDPAGLLARRLLVLDGPKSDPRRVALVHAGRRRLTRVSADPRWSRLRYAIDDEATVDLLRLAARRLLERMLSDGEGRP